MFFFFLILGCVICRFALQQDYFFLCCLVCDIDFVEYRAGDITVNLSVVTDFSCSHVEIGKKETCPGTSKWPECYHWCSSHYAVTPVRNKNSNIQQRSMMW